MIAIALTFAGHGVALADVITLGQYRQRLETARSALVAARAMDPQGAVERSRQQELYSMGWGFLQITNAIALPSGETLTIDDAPTQPGHDSPLAGKYDLTAASMDAAIARVDTRLALVGRLGAPGIDPAVADARLRDVIQQTGPAQTGDLFELLGRLVLRFLSSLNAPAIDPNVLWPAVGGLGVAAILFIVATLGRALPERVRREVLVRDGPSLERLDPVAHLRAADEAIAAGRARDAVRELFLYTVSALSDREAIRYDAALTDRELLVRAAAIPHADAFRVLVATYERTWFGMHDLSDPDIRRARELALRVAP